MRTMGNILTVPGAFAREKKVSAFKTISFLVSAPENEPGTNFSDNLSGDAGDHANVPGPQETDTTWRDLKRMSTPKNPAFMIEEDSIPWGKCNNKISFLVSVITKMRFNGD